MCKHHLSTIKQLNEKLAASTRGELASGKPKSTFAQLQAARTTNQIKCLESEVAALKEENCKLQKQNDRLSGSRNNGVQKQLQEQIVQLKAKLRECRAWGEGHVEAPHIESLQDQLSKADSTATSQVYKLTQEKLMVEAQKMEIAELKSSLEEANKARDEHARKLTVLRDELAVHNRKIEEDEARDLEQIQRLEAELKSANNGVKQMKLTLERSKSDWEGKVGALTTEIELLKALNVKTRGAAAEECCSELDEAAAIALTNMRARATHSEGHEVSRFVQVPGLWELFMHGIYLLYRKLDIISGSLPLNLFLLSA